MAVLDATVNGADSNSYATATEGDDYFEGRLNADVWTNAAPEEKDAALMMSTADLDGSLLWTGLAATGTQALGWGRIGMQTRNGYEISPLVLPRELKAAVFELALYHLTEDRSASDDVAVQGIERVKAGSLEVEFQPRSVEEIITIGNTKTTTVSGGQTTSLFRLPDAVLRLIPPSWYTTEEETAATRNYMFGVM